MILSQEEIEEEKGTIFNIQHFSVHDGPGIRTIIFAKGCPLRCLWCSNPESQKFEPEVAYKHSQCIGVKQCGLCIDSCPKNAVSSRNIGGIKIHRTICDNCGKCIEVCPSNALVFLGEHVSVNQIAKIISDDDNFYWRSGGGPTISGGEPLAQPKFTGQLLCTLKERGYHTVVETCGHIDIDAPDMDVALKNTDLLLYDIKHMDSSKHKAHTGYSNDRILENLQKISQAHRKIEIIVRTPIIPGFNDTEKDVQDIANFLRNISNLNDYELLPYHGFGAPKYAQLGRQYALKHLTPVDSDKLRSLQALAQKTLALGHLERIIER